MTYKLVPQLLYFHCSRYIFFKQGTQMRRASTETSHVISYSGSMQRLKID